MKFLIAALDKDGKQLDRYETNVLLDGDQIAAATMIGISHLFSNPLTDRIEIRNLTDTITRGEWESYTRFYQRKS